MRVATMVALIAFFVPILGHAFDVEGQDGDAHFPEGELVFKLDQVEPDNPKRRFNTLSMGYMGSSGEFDQYLSSGGYTYPEPLHNEVKLRVGYLRFIRHIYFRESLEMNWGLGLAHSTYQLTGSAMGKEAYFEDKAFGLHGQIGVAYHLTPMIAFEGALGIYTFTSDNSSLLIDPQIQFSFTPVETIRLHAGFREWNHFISFKEQRLDVNDTLSGLTAGVTLTF